MSGVLFSLFQGLGRGMKARVVAKNRNSDFFDKNLVPMQRPRREMSEKGTSPPRETKTTGSPTGPPLELNWEGTVYEASYCERSFETRFTILSNMESGKQTVVEKCS